MRIFRSLVVLLSCGFAAHAQGLQPLIDRPVTLPQGKVDLTLQGTYTNWRLGGSSLDGETLAFGVDFGAAQRVQLGLAMALPINPGAGFGSVLGSAAVAAHRDVALRLDFGFENFGTNGNIAGGHTNRFFGGLGSRIKVPITPTIAFVSGRIGAVDFGHFNNIGPSGTGLYFGATVFPELSSDFFVLSAGNNNSPVVVGINLPAGLLVQPDPHFALTLLAGYSAAMQFPSGAGAQNLVLHFIPIGLEAVVTPAPRLDIGTRFMIDGYFAQTGGNSSGNPGYFDQRALLFWIRIHA
jgi:hypothetical protein